MLHAAASIFTMAMVFTAPLRTEDSDVADEESNQRRPAEKKRFGEELMSQHRSGTRNMQRSGGGGGGGSGGGRGGNGGDNGGMAATVVANDGVAAAPIAEATEGNSRQTNTG